MKLTEAIHYHGGGGIQELYCSQPLGGDQDALASLLAICHLVHLYTHCTEQTLHMMATLTTYKL